MGLDKWIKSENGKAKTIKKKDEDISLKKSGLKSGEKRDDKEIPKLKKYDLTCSSAKCKYKKTIVKRVLIEKDKICPKCKKIMKLK